MKSEEEKYQDYKERVGCFLYVLTFLSLFGIFGFFYFVYKIYWILHG